MIHNSLFKKYGLEAYYHPFHVKKETLAETIHAMKLLNIAGFNVTVPHKERIIPYLDEIDDLAKMIGAVNTVKNESGKLIGYNTDGIGFVESLKELDNEFINKRIVIIGAGGAARAIYFSLASAGVKCLDIANRTENNALKIIHAYPLNIETNCLTLNQLEQSLHHYDIIIQTTSVGMEPNDHQSLIEFSKLQINTLVIDIIYKPAVTKFLKNAEMNGARIDNGLTMLYNQAAYAFQIWTGIFPDVSKGITT
ncbi:shikimate dehydrogenase [Bacillus kwashiorkori]|uniref:shikimate dehydrogenase n=1 Tax=Bacillus kwashiorkori TaxID=1522318 RepID=UPI0007836C6C|nr:shikimate dehydrogenase [Bacillus kwashiorkori]